MRMPWDPPETLPAVPVEETVSLLQRDFAYAMTHTAIMVHSSHAALQMLVNTRRGQIIPAGECKLSDGTVFELQDIGMPQPNCEAMSVQELTARLFQAVRELKLELAP